MPSYIRGHSNFAHKWTLLNPILKHAWVTETLARTANRTISFTESVVYADSSKTDDSGDGLTAETAKKTITAACGVAASGGIVQCADGTYLTNLEAGGYLYFNTSTKRLLIRGNATDKTAVKIQQNAAATYTVAFGATGETVFQNLTITNNQNNCTIKDLTSSNNRSFIFDNCKLESTNSGSSAELLSSKTTGTGKWIEFKNCAIIKSAGSSQALDFTFSLADCQLLIAGGSVQTTGCRLLIVLPNGPIKTSIYDLNVVQGSNHKPIQIGQDTTLPTGNIGFCDIRNVDISFAPTNSEHGLLIGRGVVNCYVVNNKIVVPAINSGVAIGLVIKSTPANVNDCIFEGNYSEGPRALIIKGGFKNRIKYNSFVGNETNFPAFDYTSYKLTTDEVLSVENVITDNNIVGYNSNIHTNPSTGFSVDDITNLKTCTINNNKYYSYDEIYAHNGDTATDYTWAEKSDFWGASDNDSTSTLLSLKNLPITLPA